jgi:putative hemolysin
VVGTYRIRRAAAPREFYSAAEYHIAADRLSRRILEQALVRAKLRARPVMQLLWSGIANLRLSLRHRADVRLRSPGTDPDALAKAAVPSQYHHHLAPPYAAGAPCRDATSMRRLEPGAIDPARTLAALPPLIKGYLRLGGFVGDGAVIDEQFNTTDVCIVVKTDLVTEKYSRHYERQSKETWAA